MISTILIVGDCGAHAAAAMSNCLDCIAEKTSSMIIAAEPVTCSSDLGLFFTAGDWLCQIIIIRLGLQNAADMTENMEKVQSHLAEN